VLGANKNRNAAFNLAIKEGTPYDLNGVGSSREGESNASI
jgi:hypothetical protein